MRPRLSWSISKAADMPVDPDWRLTPRSRGVIMSSSPELGHRAARLSYQRLARRASAQHADGAGQNRSSRAESDASTALFG